MFHNANKTVPKIGAAALRSYGRETATTSRTTNHHFVSSNIHSSSISTMTIMLRRNVHTFIRKNSSNINCNSSIHKNHNCFNQFNHYHNRNGNGSTINHHLNHSPRRTSSTTASTTKKNKSLMEWYEGYLESNPVATKMVTGSILWGLGDVVAQIVPALFADATNGNDKNTDTNTTSGTNKDDQSVSSSSFSELVYDGPRTARAMFYGFLIHAPLSHAHFNLLEWMTVRGGFSGLSIPVFKTIMEQFVYWSWISNGLYHGAMGGMQGKSLQEIYDRIADVLWDTQKAQWVFWIPVQLLNFQFVPVRHQLNVVLLTSVVWTALLSAWYPPEEEVDEIEAQGQVIESSDKDKKH